MLSILQAFRRIELEFQCCNFEYQDIMPKVKLTRRFSEFTQMTKIYSCLTKPQSHVNAIVLIKLKNLTKEIQMVNEISGLLY